MVTTLKLSIKKLTQAFLEQRQADGYFHVSRQIGNKTLLIAEKNTHTHQDVTLAEIENGILTLFPPPFRRGSGWARALNRYRDIFDLLTFRFSRFNRRDYRVGRYENQYLVRFTSRKGHVSTILKLTNPTSFNLVALEMGASIVKSCLTPQEDFE